MSETFTVAGVEVLVEGTAPETLLLLHGWPDTHRLWDGTVAALQDKFRCARFTWPGFEPSSPRKLLTLDQITALVLAVVDRLNPGCPVTLVLHDWGCIFGYQFAMRHPNRVKRIVGVDIGDVSSLVKSLPPSQLLGIAAYQWWLAFAWRFGGRIGDAMSRRMARWMRCPTDPATIRWQMNWPYHLNWFAGRESLPKRSVPFQPACPMLFVYGRRKPVRFHAKAWSDALALQPGCQVEGFDTGHWVMVEAPERFHALVRAWIPDPVRDDSSSRSA